METRNLPQMGDQRYYLHRAVVVRKMFYSVQLAEIFDLVDHFEFYVDYHALTLMPNYENSITLTKFRGELK